MRSVFIALVLSVLIIQVCCNGTHDPFSPPHSHILNGKSDMGLIAQQDSAGNTASSSASITVRYMDINDNVPEFTKQLYRTEIYENITAGTSIIQVSALDRDTGDYGLVRYTRLEGPLSDKLSLDPITGLITCNQNHGDFDREMSPEYQFTIEARDDNGNGNIATARLLLILRDVNDSPPRFLETVYKGVMSEDLLSLKVPLRVEAVDDDAEEPNNQVIYRIEKDTFYSDHFRINSQSGEISVRPSLLGVAPIRRNKRQTGLEPFRNKRQSEEDEIITFSVTAADLGVPQLKTSVPVQIYMHDYEERYVKFIYPRPKMEVDGRRNEIERTLGTLTGGIVEIKEVYSIWSKSIISALVQYTSSDHVIDLSNLVDAVCVDVFNATAELTQSTESNQQSEAEKVAAEETATNVEQTRAQLQLINKVKNEASMPIGATSEDSVNFNFYFLWHSVQIPTE